MTHKLYWKFRNLIHNGHIEKREGTGCKTCTLIHEIEKDIVKIIGEKKYFPLSQENNLILTIKGQEKKGMSELSLWGAP